MGERTVHRDETYENFQFSKSRNCPQGWIKELSTEMKLMKNFLSLRDETCENFLSPGTVHRDGCKNCPQRCLLILLFYVFDQ